MTANLDCNTIPGKSTNVAKATAPSSELLLAALTVDLEMLVGKAGQVKMIAALQEAAIMMLLFDHALASASHGCVTPLASHKSDLKRPEHTKLICVLLSLSSLCLRMIVKAVVYQLLNKLLPNALLLLLSFPLSFFWL